MARKTKQTGNGTRSRRTNGNPSNEMTGLQKAAWWSVPALGFVAFACASTLAVLFAIRPIAKDTSASRGKATPPKTANLDVAVDDKTATPSKKARQPKNVVEVENAKPAQGPQQSQPSVASLPKEKNPQAKGPPKAPTVGVPQVMNSAAGLSGTLTSLRCIDGNIEFFGTPDIQFADQSPQIEKNGKSKFERLTFNGQNQAIELPDIPKGRGTLEIVAKLPESATSILLDSSFQRLTLRKNRDGMRWRIAATKKQDKIRLSQTPVDFSKWHHYVITWESGSDAILFVDGVEHDRCSYVDEQPQFPNFQKIIVGKTRGPNGNFYRSKVHRYSVLDRVLSANEVAALNKELTETFPAFFNK